VHDWLKKLFWIFTNSTSPHTTLYQSYTTINIVQLKYFRRTIYYNRTVQRRPTKAYNTKVENAHIYLVHSLSSNCVEIRVRNYVTSFSTLHMISLFWNFSCTYKTRKIHSLECFASCICPFKELEHSNKAYFMGGSRWGSCRGSTSTVHMCTTTSE
jgi:hypothetical protein